VTAWNDNRHPSQKPIRRKTHGEINFTDTAYHSYNGITEVKKGYFRFYLDRNKKLILNFHHFLMLIKSYLKARITMKRSVFSVADGQVTFCEIFAEHWPYGEVLGSLYSGCFMTFH